MEFAKLAPTAVCDNCRDDELPKVRLIGPRAKQELVLCPRCLAQALEAGTGWRACNTVESWIRQSNRRPIQY